MPHEESSGEIEGRQEGVTSANTLPLVTEVFDRLRAPSFIHVNLDAVAHNARILKSLAGPNTGE